MSKLRPFSLLHTTFFHVCAFFEKKKMFQRSNQLVKKKEVNKEGRNKCFYK